MSKKKQAELDLSKLTGDTGLTLLNDSNYAVIYDRLPLFLPRIDRILGGGIPFGRMIEVAGNPSSGKSTLSYHIARVATALNCIVLLIDVEGTADSERLSHLGIDTSKVLVKQPDQAKGISLTVEEVGRTIESSMEIFKEKFPNTPVVIIWDSVGQTPSEEEMARDFGERSVASRARAITQLVYKIAPRVAEDKAIFVGINQVRADVGGNPMFAQYVVPGGMAWEHYASLRLQIIQSTAIKRGQDRIGHVARVNIRKSKVSKPFQVENGFLIAENGFDYEYNIAEMAKEGEILKGVGQSFEYVDSNGEIHKKRRDNFIEWLRTDEKGHEIREEILNKLIELEFPQGYPPLYNENISIEGWIDKITYDPQKEEPEPKEEPKKKDTKKAK